MSMTRPARDARAFLTDVPLNAVVLVGGCVCLLLFLFAHPSFIRSFVDADKLLAADWTRHVFHDGYGLSGFQLPRVPSLFPDLTVYSSVQIATGSWRAGVFCLAVVLCIGAIGATSVIVHRLTALPVGVGAAISWIVFAAVLLLEFAHGGEKRYDMILQPVSHGSSFVVSLCLAPMADALRLHFRPRLARLFFILCTCAVLSDKLFIFFLCIPYVIALFVVRVESADRRAILALVAGACVFGWLGSSLLHRQPDYPLVWIAVFSRIGAFFRQIRPADVLELFLPVVLLAASVFLIRRPIMDPARRDAALFYWTLAMVAILGTTALTAAFLYEDRGGYRYLVAPVWWPVIFLAAGAALVLRRHGSALVAGSCAVTLGAALLVATSGVAPADSLWTWRHPFARCLMAASERPALRDGLAQYWKARPTEVSSDWALQVDPIDPTGGAFHWGNDLASYTQSHFDRSRPPDYNFIIMDGLDRPAIVSRFGSPDHELACDAGTIWVYARPLTVAVR